MLPIAPETCLAFLIRHGAPENNLADPPILQGRRLDGALSEQGREQAVRTAERLASFPLATVYCSPLRRARETARLIAEPQGVTVQPVAELTEADVGAWERRSWVEIGQTEPVEFENFQRDPARFGYRDGENLTQVAARVVPVIQQLMATHSGEAIAIVGHNVVNRVYLASVIQLPLSHARGIAQDNCGINVLRWRAGRAQPICINSIFHLHTPSR